MGKGKTLVTQAEFARLISVSEKTVSVWKSKGRIIVSGKLVDLDASRDLLVSTGFQWPKELTLEVNSLPEKLTSLPGSLPDLPTASAAHEAKSPQPDIFSDDILQRARLGLLTQTEADRAKDNALAFKHMLAGRKAAGEIIDLAVAENVLFECARAARDAWLNWPARVGPLIAAELNVPADKVTEALTLYVHQHLAELGEPEADFQATAADPDTE